ncbi:MAG: translesion DNA synthesis-associated protein ImuA [Steroidobacteraceae bacterium]|nr:translesion DNA synthesis-associated protein ImuA [Steroidobacteraceae bacterium]
MDAMPSAAVLLASPDALRSASAASGSSPPATARPDLHALHPTLWRAHQLGRGAGRALASGFAALDAQLPGGGWPRRALTELLLAHPGIGEMRLLGPSLAATLRAGRLVMLFDPPATLSAWALAQLGLDAEQMLVIDGRSRLPGEMPARQASDSLWALEQALRSGHVGALLAWLPSRLRAERLRRLQLAAQAHDGPAFVLREMAAREHPSAAPLRLALQPAGPDRLALQLFKRHGPPLAAPLQLALPPVLSAAAQGKALARAVAAGQTPRDEPLRAAAFVDLAAG